MSLFNRLFGRTDAPGIETCSFCHLPRTHVKSLVAGPDRVYICDSCVGYAIEALEQGAVSEDRLGAARAYVLRELGWLPYPTPLAVVRRFVDAALALGAGDAPYCRQVAEAAHKAHDLDGNLRAIRAIAPTDRNVRDAVNEATGLGAQGAYEQALACLAAIPEDKFDDEMRATATLRRALFRLQAGDVAAAEATALEQAADGALGTLRVAMAAHASYVQSLENELVMVRALAAIASGDRGRAFRLLKDLEALPTASAETLELLVRVYGMLGDSLAASVTAEKALARAHPDSAIASRLRSVPRGPFR